MVVLRVLYCVIIPLQWTPMFLSAPTIALLCGGS